MSRQQPVTPLNRGDSSVSDQQTATSFLSTPLLSTPLLSTPAVEDAGDLDWHSDTSKAIRDQQPVRSRLLLYSLMLVVVSLLVWASQAEIDEVTRGEGKVIPSRQVQIVQSQDGGMVTEIAVKAGDQVEAGQLLVRLDATRFAASLRESQSRISALQVRDERLRAIVEQQPFQPQSAWLQQTPEIVRQETELYQARLDELSTLQQIARQQLAQQRQGLTEAGARQLQLQRAMRFARQELSVTRPLVDSGAVSSVELLRLERELSSLQGDKAQADARRNRLAAAVTEAERHIEEVTLNFTNQIREERTRVTAELNALIESSRGLSDRVHQTAVRSPVRGTVKQLHYNTIGGVVLPGKAIAEVVPLNDALLLEAHIRPSDIAFLRPQQHALVKFTAYDFVVYGGLEARVEQIGVDTVTDDQGHAFYQVQVRTERASLGEGLPVIPGMVAQVDILTGKKTILDYLLKPVLRARQNALTER
ncbi:MAG: HlyD family type I secretion periplasmic adaptor subunit [Marinobacterium sp.]|nr:HlyD family type I secretion periplasmic adaptor subunit [Marinobacterium sp.]